MTDQALPSGSGSDKRFAPNLRIANRPVFRDALAAVALRIGASYARRRGLGSHDVEGCAGDFVTCMLNFHDRPQGVEFLTSLSEAERLWWLSRCAHHHAITFARRVEARRQLQSPLADEQLEAGHVYGCVQTGPSGRPEYELERTAFWDRILRALAPLPRVTQRLLIACYREERSVEEAAQEIGVSPAQASVRLYRGKQRLRRSLIQ